MGNDQVVSFLIRGCNGIELHVHFPGTCIHNRSQICLSLIISSMVPASDHHNYQ